MNIRKIGPNVEFGLHIFKSEPLL